MLVSGIGVFLQGADLSASRSPSGPSSLAPIHRSAWKRNSATFALTWFSEVTELLSLHNRNSLSGIPRGNSPCGSRAPYPLVRPGSSRPRHSPPQTRGTRRPHRRQLPSWPSCHGVEAEAAALPEPPLLPTARRLTLATRRRTPRT